jgi:hypothetical protein
MASFTAFVAGWLAMKTGWESPSNILPLNISSKLTTMSNAPQKLSKEEEVADYIEKYRNDISMTSHRIAKDILKKCQSESELIRLKEDNEKLKHDLKVANAHFGPSNRGYEFLIRELEQQLKREKEIREDVFCPRCKVKLIPSTTSGGWLTCPICHISIMEQNTVSFTEWVSIEGWVFIREKRIWVNLLEILSLLKANYHSNKSKSTQELLDYFTEYVKNI